MRKYFVHFKTNVVWKSILDSDHSFLNSRVHLCYWDSLIKKHPITSAKDLTTTEYWSSSSSYMLILPLILSWKRIFFFNFFGMLRVGFQIFWWTMHCIMYPFFCKFELCDSKKFFYGRQKHAWELRYEKNHRRIISHLF